MRMTVRGAAAIAMLMLVSAVAHAAPLAENQRLALRVMKIRGEDAAARDAATDLIQTSANGFAAGAPLRDLPVNAKALRRAVRLHTKASRPKFVDATIQAYTATYSQEELGRIVAYYHKKPKKRGRLDPALATKSRQVAVTRAANLAPLRQALPTGLYDAYCARARCDDAVRGAIAAFGSV